MAVKAVAAVALPDRQGRSGAWWFLGVALVCGLLAGLAATRAVRLATHEVWVVVAERPVAPLTRIGATAVRLAREPAAGLPPGALRAVSDAAGHFTTVGLVPGEVVVSAAVATTSGTTGTVEQRAAAWREAACPARPGSEGCGGLVAMTVQVGTSEGFAMVRSGDRVDVVGSYDVGSGPVSQIVAQGVPVLDRLQGAAGTQAGPAGTGGSGWLVLGLTQAESLRVELLESSGHLAVLLRPLGSPARAAGGAAGVLSAAALAGISPPASAATSGQGG